MTDASAVFGIGTADNATCQGDTDDNENVCAAWVGEED